MFENIDRPKTRSLLINHAVETNLVPFKRLALYDFLNRAAEKKNIRSQWKHVGRGRLLDDQHLDELHLELTKCNGLTIDKNDIKKKMQENQHKLVVENGCVPITKTSISPHHSTLANYQALLVCREGVSICTSVTSKTQTRYSAENSLISAMALLCCVAATHYDVSTPETIEDETNIESADTGAKKLYEMVRKSYGNLPIMAVKPHLVLSTDDTVNYIFEGTSSGKEEFRLVGSNSLKKAGSRSKYKHDSSKAMCGMRVKLTYTFSAAGTMAPIFVSVLGLNERELPQDHIVSLEIEGLCVGGGGVTLGNKQKGYVIFMRGEKGMDKKRYEMYRDNIFLPFVSQSRKEFDGWMEGTAIPKYLKAVSWCDGDLAQVENIVSQSSLRSYKDHNICACKQNAARSGTEQAADLTKAFKLMHSLQKNVTVSDLASYTHPMKKIISQGLKSLNDKVQLKTTKKNALIDFISSLPEMTSKAVTRKNVIHGFKENGMIDAKCLSYPDFDKILTTYRTDPTKEEYKLCGKSFPYLIEEFKQKGHIPDKTFEELGFPMDRSVDGSFVRRNADINQESKQRAKVLTHAHQVELREARLWEVRSETKRKIADKIYQLKLKLMENNECEKKLKEFVNDICNATHEDFDKCKAAELKAFIIARKPSLPKSKLPKKGSIALAITGEESNLISMAYGCRSDQNVLQEEINKKEQELDEFNVQKTDIQVHVRQLQIEDSLNMTHLSSCLFADAHWVDIVCFCFNHDIDVDRDISNQKQKADIVNTMLLQRLTQYVHKRIADENKRDSWCFKWAAKNMAHMACLMVLFGHVKDDVDCLDEDSMLLSATNNFKIASNEENKNRHGAYLYYDCNDAQWIRSGKATGRGFSAMNEEYLKRAKSKRSSSQFDLRYPSKTNTQRNPSSRRGYFENLSQFVAIGFDVNNEKVTKQMSEKIFDISDDDRKEISSLNFKGKHTVEMKILDVVSHLFELAYNLAISPLSNVSNNLCFESCL